MSVKPIGERILIKPKSEEKTKGGIYIPTNSDDTNEGVIVEVGDVKESSLKKGDNVIYDPIDITKVTIEGEKHIVIKIKNVIAVVE